MRFALLGDHPHGLDFALTLHASGLHELAVYAGPSRGFDFLQARAITCPVIRDLEEFLAHPTIDAIIVASGPRERPVHLRRALQSERHVLCVHPADGTPDIAYEAAMIQGDTKRVLLPLLPDALHPAISRIAGWRQDADSPVGKPRLLDCRRVSPDPMLLETASPRNRLAIPHWEMFRAIWGEIAEVVGFTATEELKPNEPLMLSGQFEKGGLLRVLFLPGQVEDRLELRLLGDRGEVELLFPAGPGGPALLQSRSGQGPTVAERFEARNPWNAVLESFERAVCASADPESTLAPDPLTWQTEIRCLELDDAARRSVERRRAVSLEYPEASEEAGFKGTMTLVGCSVLWGCVLLLILSAWVPWLGWLILPLLIFFLGLQCLRWLAGKAPEKPGAAGASVTPGDKEETNPGATIHAGTQRE